MSQIERKPPNIVDAGHDRERYREIETPSLSQTGPIRAIDLIEQRQRHADNLGRRIGFAEPGWPEDFHGAGGVKQSADDQDDDVAAENQDGVRPANNVGDGEHEKHGAEQQLVGDRIKVLSQRGFLLQYARQQAVKPVGDPGGNKNYQRPGVILQLDGNHHEGNEDQLHQRY